MYVSAWKFKNYHVHSKKKVNFESLEKKRHPRFTIAEPFLKKFKESVKKVIKKCVVPNYRGQLVLNIYLTLHAV